MHVWRVVGTLETLDSGLDGGRQAPEARRWQELVSPRFLPCVYGHIGHIPCHWCSGLNCFEKPGDTLFYMSGVLWTCWTHWTSVLYRRRGRQIPEARRWQESVSRTCFTRMSVARFLCAGSLGSLSELRDGCATLIFRCRRSWGALRLGHVELVADIEDGRLARDRNGAACGLLVELACVFLHQVDKALTIPGANLFSEPRGWCRLVVIDAPQSRNVSGGRSCPSKMPQSWCSVSRRAGALVPPG